MKQYIQTIVICLIIFLSLGTTMIVNALPSPTASIEYHLTIQPTKGGGGTYNITDTQQYQIKAKPKDGYIFAYWEFVGNYKILEGTYKSSTLKLEIYSDVIAIPYFSKDGEIIKDIPKVDTSNISPSTGDNNKDTIRQIAIILLSISNILLATAFIISNRRK